MKTFKIVGNDLSDGYHTFDELYEHRCLLFINLCLLMPKKARIGAHEHDGWFVMYLDLPTGQISYHLPTRMLPLVEDRILGTEHPIWDGHTSEDVANRLEQHAWSQG